MLIKFSLKSGYEITVTTQDTVDMKTLVIAMEDNEGWFLSDDLAVNKNNIEWIELEEETVDEFLQMRISKHERDEKE